MPPIHYFERGSVLTRKLVPLLEPDIRSDYVQFIPQFESTKLCSTIVSYDSSKHLDSIMDGTLASDILIPLLVPIESSLN